MSKLFLKIEDVTFRYLLQSKHNIIKHTSLEIEDGKTVLIVGNSGCGKSTLAAVAAGLYPENAGELLSGKITLCGEDISRLSCRKRAQYLSMMFQNPDLQFCMDTLRKEMIFCMENICIAAEFMDEKLTLLAKEMKVEHLLDQKLHTLSGGEKQKAMLCCLLLLQSRGIIFDEPFANLDEEASREIVELLKQQKLKYQRTIIAIDHRLDVWMDLLDEIIVLSEGARVIQRGITRENLHEYEELFQREGLHYPKEKTYFCKTVRDRDSEEDSNVKRDKQSERNSKSAIRLKNVSLAREGKNPRSTERLLDSVSVDLKAGEITAILGSSGCGKTSLLRAILKQRSYEGSIEIEGKKLERMKEYELFQTIGTVFQNPANQFIATQVQAEVEQSLAIWYPKLKKEERKEEALRLLEQYGLKQYRKYSPYMLSQGQQRRLAVLSILTGGQRILLLDEPTYGQDAKSTRAMMNQIQEIVETSGVAVLFTTHDKFLAGEYADAIYECKGGNLVPWSK